MGAGKAGAVESEVVDAGGPRHGGRLLRRQAGDDRLDDLAGAAEAGMRRSAVEGEEPGPVVLGLPAAAALVAYGGAGPDRERA
jgi:hypothetical protein